MFCLYSFPASGFYCLLITFENSFDPNQVQQFVCPDQDPNSFDNEMALLKDTFVKSSLMTKWHTKLPIFRTSEVQRPRVFIR